LITNCANLREWGWIFFAAKAHSTEISQTLEEIFASPLRVVSFGGYQKHFRNTFRRRQDYGGTRRSNPWKQAEPAPIKFSNAWKL